jgi:HSP20 family protein
MTLPARRQRAGRLAELGVPGWGRDPIAEFDDLFNRMGRLLESTVGPAAERTAWAPLADMYETDDGYVVEADLPGVKRDDVDVEINERELVVTGELKEREREGALRRGTRRTGRFEYRVLLPTDIKAEEISATLAEGVLTLTVPKAEPAKSRHIEITSED